MFMAVLEQIHFSCYVVNGIFKCLVNGNGSMDISYTSYQQPSQLLQGAFLRFLSSKFLP